MRVALLSANAQAGDALGNQLAEKLAFFLERGADVRAFVSSAARLHPALRRHCQEVSRPDGDDRAWGFVSSADLVVVDYSQDYPLLDWLPLLAERKTRVVLDYHGVTPAQLWGNHNREAIERGAERRGMVWCSDWAIAHSAFARRELLQPTGFPAEHVVSLGYPIDIEAVAASGSGNLRAELGLQDATILLYVGRLALNKRLPVLVEALARLRERTPSVHAVLVGDDSDVYEEVARSCREVAAELDVADRLHILGHVSSERLAAAYRDADLLVVPSVHEGFCIPVLEAMACGLPVVAARAAALPETVGDAGLTFAPEDADDLARQVVRVLDSAASGELSARRASERDGNTPRAPADSKLRVAVVSCRYGTDFVGGAETSLRTIAETLHRAGHRVEVFTTCSGYEHSGGTNAQNGVPVHRFPLDPLDPHKLERARLRLEQSEGTPSAEVQRKYLERSPRSGRLLAALQERIDQLDAVIVGPYLLGLTHDLARAFPDKVLLLPCFHDEAAARLPALGEAYRQVGGILYHTPEEQALAESELGINNPGAVCCGAFLDAESPGDAQRGRQRIGKGRRYLVYCGRYSPHKGLPKLLEYARRYAATHPERFTFCFMGQGDFALPQEPWLRDLGFVDEQARRDVIAGAAALVQLSRLESLSLAALEAWAEGVPLIADAGCAVLRGHLKRCRGGRAVEDYTSFARALDDLWERPAHWQSLGRLGREYAVERYGERGELAARLTEAIRDLPLPLVEKMRQRGQRRAERHARPLWREQFGRLVEQWLDSPPRPYEQHVEVQPRTPDRTVTAGAGAVLVPVRVVNRGSHAVLAEGPSRVVVRCQIQDEAGQLHGTAVETPLPGVALPGQSQALAVLAPVPQVPGVYWIAVRAVRAGDDALPLGEAAIMLTVEEGSKTDGLQPVSLPDGVQAALVSAAGLRRLPDDYTDITLGLFARWKRAVKRKLLNNFKRAYIDVLSHQQSTFNQHVVTALQELSESCSTLGHAVQHKTSSVASSEGGPLLPRLLEQLAASQQQCASLEQRLAALERRLCLEEVVS